MMKPGQELLLALLKQKKERNPAYSIAALARDIGISQPHLTRIINGNRRLTPFHAYKIGKYLEYPPLKQLELIVSTFEK